MNIQVNRVAGKLKELFADKIDFQMYKKTMKRYLFYHAH